MSDKVLLIVNPASAGGRTARLFDELRRPIERALGPVDVAFTARARHATELARAAAREGRERIVAVGGDGTFSEVAGGVFEAGTGSAVGVIHQGTGGDFRRSLELEHRLDHYLAAIGRNRPKPVDVGIATFTDRDGHPAERPFFNVASFGMGGLVDRYVEEGTRLLGGTATYFAASLKALVSGEAAHVGCEVELAGERRVERFETRIIAACNGRFAGGGMRLAPNAELDDGAFDVVAVTGSGRLPVLRALGAVYRGDHLSLGNVRSFRASKLTVAPVGRVDGERFLVDLDGEWAGSGPLTVAVRPRALKVLA